MLMRALPRGRQGPRILTASTATAAQNAVEAPTNSSRPTIQISNRCRRLYSIHNAAHVRNMHSFTLAQRIIPYQRGDPRQRCIPLQLRPYRSLAIPLSRIDPHLNIAGPRQIGRGRHHDVGAGLRIGGDVFRVNASGRCDDGPVPHRCHRLHPRDQRSDFRGREFSAWITSNPATAASMPPRTRSPR